MNLRNTYKEVKLVSKCFDKISRKTLKKVYRKFIQKKPSAEDYFIFSLLKGNLHTLRCVEYLERYGNIEEAEVLQRFILERLSLIFVVVKNSFGCEEIDKLVGYKCIGELIKLFPFLGKYYGETSKTAHSVPRRVAGLLGVTSLRKNGKVILKFVPLKTQILLEMCLCLIKEINYAITEFFAKKFIDVESWAFIKGSTWKYVSILGETPFGLATLHLHYAYLKKNIYG